MYAERGAHLTIVREDRAEAFRRADDGLHAPAQSRLHFNRIAMPRLCTICQHEARAAIEAALVGNGSSFRDIAGQYAVSKSALQRHKAEHLPPKLTKAKQAEEVAEATGLLRQIRTLQAVTLRILRDAEADGERRTALKAVAEARRNIELLGKLAGELQQEGAVTIINSPQYVELRAVIVEALAGHPEARLAVANALTKHAEEEQ